MRIVNDEGKEEYFDMKKGDVFEIAPKLKHQFIGTAEITEIVEFSTEHFETDSIRTERGD